MVSKAGTNLAIPLKIMPPSKVLKKLLKLEAMEPARVNKDKG